ncbi:Protein canopy 2 [Halocaridina rubra]|uniref:Protein canopy 2 n=1 Tax=Halocaridina rubra TaxID=373956 RepID=A0AAN8ZPM7_HALRR
MKADITEDVTTTVMDKQINVSEFITLRGTLSTFHAGCDINILVNMDTGLFQLLYMITLFTSALTTSPPKSKIVKCAVCNSLVGELHDAVSKVDPRKKINVGSYRIDADGGQKLSSVKYAGSEAHMMEVLESVCDNFKDYAQAQHKETGKIETIKLVVDGAMNPRFSEYEMIQDPDLNKGLNFHCDAIVEEYEDEIIAHFKTNSDREVELSQFEFCNDVTGICKDVKEEL